MNVMKEILSIRTYNILMHEGIDTMGELKARWRKDRLYKIKGIGHKSRREIEFAINNSDVSYSDAIERMHHAQEGLSRMSEDVEFWKARYQDKAEQYNQLIDIRAKTDESVDTILRKSKIMMAYIGYMKSKLENDSINHVSLEEFSLIYSGGYGE